MFGDEAVYTGGKKKIASLTQTSCHIGRINLSNNQWAWHKDFYAGIDEVVTGLAVDATGTKLATHVGSVDNLKQFIFVLDTGSG